MKTFTLTILLFILSQVSQAQVVSAFTEKCMNEIYSGKLMTSMDEITITTLKDIDLNSDKDFDLNNEEYIKYMKNIGNTHSDGTLRTYLATQHMFSYSNFWTDGFKHYTSYGFIPKNTKMTFYIEDIQEGHFKTFIRLKPASPSIIQNVKLWTADGLGYRNTRECSYGNRPFINPNYLIKTLNKRFKTSLIVDSVRLNKQSW